MQFSGSNVCCKKSLLGNSKWNSNSKHKQRSPKGKIMMGILCRLLILILRVMYYAENILFWKLTKDILVQWYLWLFLCGIGSLKVCQVPGRISGYFLMCAAQLEEIVTGIWVNRRCVRKWFLWVVLPQLVFLPSAALALWLSHQVVSRQCSNTYWRNTFLRYFATSI